MTRNAELTEQDLRDLGRYPPEEILEALDQLDAEESLRSFIELAWSILEPGRKFVGGWHIDAICEHLEAVTNGQILRLLMNVPPGCMKSLTTDAFWPAWEWGPGGRPELRYVSSSYSDLLTIRDNRRCRTLIQSPLYQRLWGDRFKLVSDQNAKTRFDNDHMGFKIATSVGGLGAGERGDRFIIDDPHNIKDGESKAKREEAVMWVKEVVPTRVSDPEKSAILCIMQCVADGDVSAELQEQGYVHLMLPMEFEPDRKCFVEVTGFSDPRTEENELLWPDRMTRAVVERDKKAMGEYAVAAQFQQRPAPRGGGMFRRTWWRFFETGHPKRPWDCDQDAPALPPPANFDVTVLTVDCAFKSVATGSRVGMLAIGAKGPFRYVLANRTRHMTFTQTIENILAMLKEFPKCSRVLVEDKANGSAVVDTLRQLVSGIVEVQPEGGKEARASAMQPAVESGHWVLPEGAAWLDDFITEFALFPSSANDDQVDAASQASIYLTQGVSVTRALGLGKR